MVGTACNSGTSCFVTKKGELYVFGKDSSHADFSTGRVADLTNQETKHICMFILAKIV